MVPTRRRKLETGMITLDRRFDQRWQVDCLAWMAMVALQQSEPDVQVEAWLDSADQADDRFVSWAIVRWEGVRCMTAFELEHLLKEARAWQLAHPIWVRHPNGSIGRAEPGMYRRELGE